MAEVFSEYAHYYDALYQDKDYEKECNALEEIFARHQRGPIRSILDLGCGTGGHALALAQRGYEVTGVDRSVAMLDYARCKSRATQTGDAAGHTTHTPSWQQAEIQDLHLARTFDATISMFAVMSYMVTNNDLLRALHAARRHLTPTGLCIFDAWYGPGVLTHPPSKEMKEVCHQYRKTIRFAHPVVDTLTHTCAVHYRLLYLENDVLRRQTSEVHTMRFLFPQEVYFLADATGFVVEALFPALEVDKSLSTDCFIFTSVLRAC